MCLSVKQHLTYGASVRPENAVTYSAGNEGQNICGGFSETAPLQRSSTPSVVRLMRSRPFLSLLKMRMHCSHYAEGLHFSDYAVLLMRMRKNVPVPRALGSRTLCRHNFEHNGQLIA